MVETVFYAAITVFAMGLVVQMIRFKKQGRAFFYGPKRLFPSGPAGFGLNRFSPVRSVLNALLQVRLFKAGKIRWGVHFVLFTGFGYLVMVHGLHRVTADLFFDDYQPTLNPFQGFRNICGLMVMIGCLGFLIRRMMFLRINADRAFKWKGVFTIGLILAVISSGFLLEASKMVSEPVFMEMVEDYSDLDDGRDLTDLKRYWQENYAVVFKERGALSGADPENGRVINEDYCLYCHSPNQSAFVSRTIARGMSAVGNRFNAARADIGLYWIHYLLCLSLLIVFPFSRLFHMVLIPLNTGLKTLTAKQLQERKARVSIPALHACTRCGYCSRVCSVYPNFQIHQNPDILPHHKIKSVQKMILTPGRINIDQLNAGNNECTLCHHCTDICPSGIDLQHLWTALDDRLARMGLEDPADLIRRTPLNEWNRKEGPEGLERKGAAEKLTFNLAGQAASFENCIQCTVCTNVCPVVDYDSRMNDMAPHQIMNLLRLDKKHLATGTRMVWSCLTCYACQENCPQGIKVADIILELRNAGSVKAGTMARQEEK